MRRLSFSLLALLLAGCATPTPETASAAERAQAARDRYWQVQETQRPNSNHQP